MEYELELDRAAREIKDSTARSVCIQLPDGLKPKAKEITDFLEKNTSAKITIWAGTCYGACDTPRLDEKDFDMLIQWGHSEWKSQHNI